MRICLLTTQDLLADPFPSDDWPCDPRPFYPHAHWQVATLYYESAVAQVTQLIRDGFDLFFNLCDGAADQEVPGIEVVQTLEKHGVPFVGSTSEFYEPTREQMKQACRKHGIATPDYRFVSTDEQIEEAAEGLRFPLFVKHHSSYASVALSKRSRVVTREGLRKQAQKIIRRFGTALVEEYIEGIECTVLVAENPDDPLRPTTYQPIQYRFPDGESFKHSNMKWVEYDSMSSFPISDRALDRRLRDAAARFFVALNGASFGRCDVRVDREGTPYMLEMNANCGIYYPPTDPGSADLCLMADPAGHEGFTAQLIAAAFRRHGRHRSTSSEWPETSAFEELRLELEDPLG